MPAYVTVFWLALAATAHARPASDAGLVWRAPDGCPDGDEILARIERRMGTPIERAVHGIAVEISTEGDGPRRRFVARIDLRAVTVANEVRLLSSAQCGELADAVAVVIARVAAETSRARADAARAEELARNERPAVAHGTSPMQPRAWGAGLRAIGVSGVGALPGVELGGQLAGYARLRSLLVELGAARWKHNSYVLRAGAPGEIDIGLDAVALRLGWGPERLPLRGWAAGELGVIEGEGVALERSDVGRGRWLAVGAGFGVAWPMTPRIRLFGMVELMVPLARARFLLQDGTEVYRPGPANARCGLGLEVGWR